MGVIQTEEKSLCRQYYDKQASEASFGNKCVCLTITDAVYLIVSDLVYKCS
jgi:hypothetical protein